MNEYIKNGLIGKFAGWRLNGRTFDPDGKEIHEEHEPDCFCCRDNLFTPTQENKLSAEDKKQV